MSNLKGRIENIIERIVNYVINKIEQQIHWWRHIHSRKKFTERDMSSKDSNIKARLSENDIREIKSLYSNNFNILKKGRKWYMLYKTLWPNDSLKYFIPDNFYYMYIDDYFADRRDCNIIDDKNFYDMFFYDVKQPRTIARREDGELLTFDYRPLNFEEFSALCKEEKRVIIKQSVNSSGGKGVAFYDAEHDPTSKLKDCLKNKNFIVQEVVNQHHELSKLHPESLNTIRIMTFFFEGKVHVLSAVVRMGVAGAKVDNASSGGIVCGINSDGTLKDRAFDTKANCYPVHPSSGVHFESVTIPNFNEFLELCKRLALRFINNTKLISWDFAVNSDGHPELIEVNLSYGEIDFHQMCNGSIFGPMTEKVIRYVFENNPRLKK